MTSPSNDSLPDTLVAGPPPTGCVRQGSPPGPTANVIPQGAWLQMTDATSGWAVGTDILRTADGGQTWRVALPAPQTVCRPDEAVIGPTLALVPTGTLGAWVVATHDGAPQEFFVTGDGGSTWSDRTYSLPADAIATALAFSALERGWMAVARIGSNQSPDHDPGVYGTTDGGMQWRHLSGRGLPSSGRIAAMAFYGGKNGWAVIQVVGTAALYMTADGGQSWRRQTIPGVAPVEAGDTLDESMSPPRLWSDGTGVLAVVATDWRAPDRGVVDVLRTSDGGETWQSGVPLITGAGPAAFTAFQEAQVVDAKSGGLAVTSGFADAAHGWVTDGSSLFATANGGESWSRVPWTLGPLREIEFPDSMHGWGLAGPSGAAQLVRTADGGRTWVVLTP